ncbi:pyridoxamine 5'-phosphate oxidase [Meridianimarinicoccus sp. MJW13]|uniref:pyridoxamine 5'-phosphate oxidase n=1 Tax=Meridianimarinicoccus sp. MJW13 TaxID=2720031 RepID=UPI0018675C0D|nr:pyridoxamine 5'-phosphate oxidase [Fluviibacterium sp. MJW13]
MSERSGIFSGEDPFAISRQWLDEARKHEVADPDAAALATVDAGGLPNVRVVLMRGIEDNGFVFYTNYHSAKGQEIAATGKAAFVIHWKTLKRQIRVRGPVEQVSPEQSDAYFASRALQSRIGAWASQQSQPLKSRASLMADVARLGLKLGPHPERPPHWGGYRITPVEIEFWADGEFRLHNRFQWRREKEGSSWTVNRLSP